MSQFSALLLSLCLVLDLSVLLLYLCVCVSLLGVEHRRFVRSQCFVLHHTRAPEFDIILVMVVCVMLSVLASCHVLLVVYLMILEFVLLIVQSVR